MQGRNRLFSVESVSLRGSFIGRPDATFTSSFPHIKSFVQAVNAVKNNAYLENRWNRLPVLRVLSGFLSVFPDGLLVSLYYLIRPAVLTAGYTMCKYLNDPKLSVAFGVVFTIDNFTTVLIWYANSETLMIRASKFFGAGLHNMVRSTLMNSITLITMILILEVVGIVFYGDRILRALGFEESLAKDCQSILIKILPVSIISQYTEIISSYLISLGVETSNYGYMIIASIISVIFGYLLLFFTPLGIWSYVITNIIIQITLFSILLSLFYKKLDPKYTQLPTLIESLPTLCTYCIDFLFFFISSVGEFLGWEIIVYFAILTGDIDQVAAMTYVVNVACYIFNLSKGPSSVSKAVVNTLLGAQCKRAAKKFSTVFLVGLFLIGVIFGIGLYFGAEWVALLFVSSNQRSLRALVTKVFRAYSLWIPQDIIFVSMMATARSAGLTTLSIILNIVFPIVGQISVALWLKSTERLNWFAILYNTYIMFFVMFVCLGVVMATMNWKNIPDLQDEQQPLAMDIIKEEENDARTEYNGPAHH